MRDSSPRVNLCFERNAAEIACAVRLGHRFRPEGTKTAALIRGLRRLSPLRKGKQERSGRDRGAADLRFFRSTFSLLSRIVT